MTRKLTIALMVMLLTSSAYGKEYNITMKDGTKYKRYEIGKSKDYAILVIKKGDSRVEVKNSLVSSISLIKGSGKKKKKEPLPKGARLVKGIGVVYKATERSPGFYKYSSHELRNSNLRVLYKLHSEAYTALKSSDEDKEPEKYKIIEDKISEINLGIKHARRRNKTKADIAQINRDTEDKIEEIKRRRRRRNRGQD